MPSTALLEPAGALVPGATRIAVLRSNSIGDFVVALPALEALRAAYPDATITYLGTTWHPALLEGRPGSWDRVVVVPRYPGVRDEGEPARDSPQVRRFVAEQRAERYDLAVQLHGGGGNSNPFVAALGARVTAGSRDDGAPALDRWTRYAHHQHEILRFLEVVGLVGAAPVTLEPRLAVTAADRAAAAEALGDDDAPLVAAHPGANDPRRRWAPESFAIVAQRLAELGARIVVVGHGPDDEQAAARIADSFDAAGADRPLDLVGRLGLGPMLGVLERCRLVVANDSGPRHLAAAVGAATVGVYWVGNLVNAGPLTRARHRVAVSFRVTCPACGADPGQGRCPHDESFVDDVPVDDVLAAALDLYANEEGRTAEPADR
ncbi:MAG: glycosyltransferase family 9 protein [Frankiaceae bacterium]